MNFYLIQRKDIRVLLYPHREPVRIKEDFDAGDCRGWFGSYPDEQDRTLLLQQLHYLCDRSAERLFHEKDFFLRYILTLGVFLFLFFFFSYVLRDPVPLVDEVVLSLAGAFAFQFAWRQKRSRSILCDRIKLELRSQVDVLSFEESEELKKLELYLQGLDHRSEAERLQWRDCPDPLFFDRSEAFWKQFLLALQNHWTPREWRNQRRNFNKGKVDEDMDLSLIVLMMKIGNYSTF